MIDSLHITLIASCAVILALLFLLIFKRCCCRKTHKGFVVSSDTHHQSLHNGIARLHQVSPHHHQNNNINNNNNNYYVFQSKKQSFFNWDDHPSLITDAVENGWPRFAFTTFISSSPSVKSSLLGVCAAADNETNVEIGWEVSEGSADYMQRIRLNPGVKKIITSSGNNNNNNSCSTRAVIRTGLPLPGPRLENSSFPQVAYFEITILPLGIVVSGDEKAKKLGKLEGEKIKLIGEDFKARDICLSHSERVEELKKTRDGKNNNEVILLCVGLSGGGPVVLKIPGSYPGSIGFNSSGSVYLGGTKLVLESENNEWGTVDKVIGCGFNPSQKRVFFTVDSQLVHEIHCKTEEFSFPLYPTLAANADVMVLVNLGQSPFRYAPSNFQRTSNPCFIGSLQATANSPALGYEDSKELFSMGRIDSLWHQRSATRSNNNTVNSIKALEYDQESEGELFEIVLDSIGRSPYAATPN